MLEMNLSLKMFLISNQVLKKMKLFNPQKMILIQRNLKENKERVKFISSGNSVTVSEFVPKVERGNFKQGDFGEPFNYSIENATYELRDNGKLISFDYNEIFSCKIQLEFVEKKKDETDTSVSGEKEAKKKKSSKPTDDSKYDVVCVKIKDNTIYLNNRLH